MLKKISADSRKLCYINVGDSLYRFLFLNNCINLKRIITQKNYYKKVVHFGWYSRLISLHAIKWLNQKTRLIWLSTSHIMRFLKWYCNTLQMLCLICKHWNLLTGNKSVLIFQAHPPLPFDLVFIMKLKMPDILGLRQYSC